MPAWAERFDAHDVWWAPINTPRTVLSDPQVEASGAFVEMSGDDGDEPGGPSPARSTSTTSSTAPAPSPRSASTPPSSSDIRVLGVVGVPEVRTPAL